ncbi:thioesterase superfamily protein [Rhizobium sp. PDO1-076]|uniref:acyl-CoA thioesterase n=1 Tax=Rhizobium sp. PDO1-076 TaxID=1125979 RepID=UPI00024E2BCD|nr:thioesterase family protein [Rhizobium sp. PDO1-076]EHS49193.1 thioesterase superfamily protein [Rhizobium sp. PDO1-076]
MNQLPRLDDFPCRSYDKLRYGDTDRQGHVNNAVFATFLETGRVEMIFAANEPLLEDGFSFVVAKLEINYLAEILWPGTVDIGTRIVKVGRSSVTMQQAVFQNGVCCASAETVVVHFDQSTRRSHAFSDAQRVRLLGADADEPVAATDAL